MIFMISPGKKPMTFFWILQSNTIDSDWFVQVTTGDSRLAILVGFHEHQIDRLDLPSGYLS